MIFCLISSRPAVEFLCSICEKSVLICRSCWRNQKYCSHTCAKNARLKRHRTNQRKYRQTEKGIKTHALCQRRYRLRNKKIETDRTTKRHFSRAIKPFENGKCSFCESSVTVIAALSITTEVPFLSIRKKERELSEKKVRNKYGPHETTKTAKKI